MEHLLKIGFIIADANEVPAWYYETIKNIIEKGYPAFFVLLKQHQGERRRPSLLYNLFEKFEERWFTSEFDAKKTNSVQHLITNDNSIHLSANGLSLSAIDFENVKSLQLHVLYTVAPLSGNKENISEAVAYGLWSLLFGYGKYTLNTLPAFWEVMDNSPVTGSYLLVHKNGKASIAYEGTTSTVPYSVKNNFNSIAWKSSSFLLFRLAELEKKKASFLSACKILQVNYEYLKTTRPGNLQMAFLFLKNILGYTRYKIKTKLDTGRFTVYFSFEKFKPGNRIENKFYPVFLPNKDVFYADPFAIEKDGITYIFIEEMVFSKGKAHISVFTIEKDKRVSLPKPVLERPYHLSYPYVFEYEGAHYMIPETAANKTVELYKAADFPYQWQFIMNLMEGVTLMDVTLHFDNNRWWLFANSHNHPFASTNDQLFLFYSDHLFSKHWRAHPQNPIATHADNCRPAGPIFNYQNKLFRPAQNNASQQYGYGLKINEIEILNETTYKEKEVYALHPDDLGLKACHHISFSDSVIVIDGISK